MFSLIRGEILVVGIGDEDREQLCRFGLARIAADRMAGAGWLEADEAIFVASPRIKTPMHGGVLAYADAAAAEKAATAHGGKVMHSFEALTAVKGEAR